MGKLWKNWLVTFVVVLTVSASFIKLADARAKSGFWDEEEEEEEDFWGGKEEEGSAARSNLAAASVLGASSVAEDPHANHPPSHHVHSAPADPKQNWDPSGGMTNANYAAHNESCGPTGKSCIPRANLECSNTDGTGRCVCIIGWVYVRSTESCWKIPRSEEEECAHDVQCQAGKWGELSRCNKIPAKCECYDFKTSGKRETILVDKCYIKKSVGDLCDSHEECDKPIEGEAYCQFGDYDSVGGHKYNGSCQCRDTHTWYKPLTRCLQKSTKLGDPCVISQQCREGTLGKLSKCNPDTEKCECFAYGGPENKTNVVYYEYLKKCFLKKEYNDTCSDVDECRANLGPDVECGPTEDFPDTDVCHCPKGKVCRNSGFTVLMGAGTICLGFVVTFLGMKMQLVGSG